MWSRETLPRLPPPGAPEQWLLAAPPASATPSGSPSRGMEYTSSRTPVGSPSLEALCRTESTVEKDFYVKQTMRLVASPALKRARHGSVSFKRMLCSRRPRESPQTTRVYQFSNVVYKQIYLTWCHSFHGGPVSLRPSQIAQYEGDP